MLKLCPKCKTALFSYVKKCPNCTADLESTYTPKPEDSYEYRDCPFCAERIKKKAIKCKHCSSVVEPIIEEEKEYIPPDRSNMNKCVRCQNFIEPSAISCTICGFEQ